MFETRRTNVASGYGGGNCSTRPLLDLTLIYQDYCGLEFGFMTESYFFTNSLVFSSWKVESFIDDSSPPSSCPDTVGLDEANTY